MMRGILWIKVLVNLSPPVVNTLRKPLEVSKFHTLSYHNNRMNPMMFWLQRSWIKINFCPNSDRIPCFALQTLVYICILSITFFHQCCFRKYEMYFAFQIDAVMKLSVYHVIQIKSLFLHEKIEWVYLFFVLSGYLSVKSIATLKLITCKQHHCAHICVPCCKTHRASQLCWLTRF